MELSTRRNLARSLVAIASLLVASSARAAPLLVDDFEAGVTLTSNGGNWSQQVSVGSNTAETSSEARRRGSLGFRFADRDATDGARFEGEINRSLSTTPSSYYLRFWFRIASSTSAGQMVIAHFCGTDCNFSRGDVMLTPDRTLEIQAETANGYQKVSSGTRLSEGTWYLIELATNNLGSATDGRVRAWVNGQLAAEMSGRNFSGRTVGRVGFGMPWTEDGTFFGELDFDDVHVDDAPLPSRFQVDGPASIETGACVPLTFSLRDSLTRARAPAPYAVSGVPVTLTGGGSAALYSNSTCTAKATTVEFGVESSETRRYLKATTTGTTTVSVGNASGDFLPAGRDFTVVQGAPPPAPNGTSCSQSAQCTSGFCVDGVCCNSACNAGACDACSVQQGAEMNGTCSLLAAGTVCRGPSGSCDASEACTGTSGACPPDSNVPEGTVCREAAGVCDVAESCSGVSKTCPGDLLVAEGQLCSLATTTHQASFCSGVSASCPEAALQTPSTKDEALPLPAEPLPLPGAPGTGPEPGEAPADNGAGEDLAQCSTDDCVETADLGFSCASTGAAGVGSVLICLLWAVARLRPTERG